MGTGGHGCTRAHVPATGTVRRTTYHPGMPYTHIRDFPSTGRPYSHPRVSISIHGSAIQSSTGEYIHTHPRVGHTVIHGCVYTHTSTGTHTVIHGQVHTSTGTIQSSMDGWTGTECGQMWPNVAKCGPNRAKYGQMCPNMAKYGPNRAK